MSDRVQLWTPAAEEVEGSELRRYHRWLTEQHGVGENASYRELWQWSVDDVGCFWDSVWEFYGVIGERGQGPACAGEQMPGARWYPEARLNYAENFLRWAQERGGEEALIGVHEDDRRESLTWNDLSGQVGAVAHRLRQLGVGPGDRVCAVLPSIPQTVVALLATVSIGAIWSVVNPDFGATAVRERFEQIEPKVLFTVDGYQFNGTYRDQVAGIADLLAVLPAVEHHILVDQLASTAREGASETATATSGLLFSEIVTEPREPVFEPVGFNHPLWVLYSSGTTGRPKGIVHSHGGVVLEALRANGLQYDVTPGDRVYFVAATTWVMWNIMIDAMFCGATVITYDGAPAHGEPDKQFQICSDERVTLFGAGAAVLTMIEKSGVSPARRHDLSALRMIFSSGSPLSESTWGWLYEHVNGNFRLGSESGGTDVASAFVGSNPYDPVYKGELMGPYLGVAVDTLDSTGISVMGEVGELVITKPLPSMPLMLWNDPDMTKYHDAYFDTFRDIWRHGDWATQLPSGQVMIHGRSDATINRGGIRMGSAEICQIVEDVPGVQVSMVLGVELAGGDYYMPLFVVPQDGAAVDEDLKATIVRKIRTELSPRYVPDAIIEAPDVPRTRTGKVMEVPIKRVFQGKDPATVDREASANPETLEWFLGYAADFASTARAA